MVRRLGIAMTPLLALLMACGPGIRESYTVGGAASDAHAIRFPIVRHHPSGDSVFVATCPTDGGGGIEAGRCWWQRAGSPTSQPASASRSVVARAAAGIDHGCHLDQVMVRSNGSREGVEGYWLMVCGVQRFYQWAEQQGRFVERQPE